jgi:hypothetical protein
VDEGQRVGHLDPVYVPGRRPEKGSFMILKNLNLGRGSLVLAILCFSAGCAQKAAQQQEQAATPPTEPAAQSAAAPADATARLVAEQMPTYPTDKCVVCDSPLNVNGTPVDVLKDGRLVRVCCTGCGEKFTADPATAMAKLDAAIIAAQSPTYAAKTCPIEDAKLGSMGDPVKIVHGTRLVELCCAHCVPAFDKDPAAAMAKIDAAYMDAQRASYTATTCPLMNGMKIDAMGGPKDILYGTQLVRLCCDDCVDKFWENPEAAMAQIAQSSKDAKAAPAGS